MRERRRQHRERTPARIVVLDRATDERLGYVANLSAGGILLRSRVRIELNRSYELSLKLPDEVCGYTQLDVTGLSLWCKPGPQSDLWDTGIQIFDMPACIEQIIALLVQDVQYQRWLR